MMMIGRLKLKVYRSIRSVFVIRISVENESGAFRHTMTSPWGGLGSEMGTWGHPGDALEVGIACTRYMRGA